MSTKMQNNTRACQDLVNAQVSVNRAVFAMNKQSDLFFNENRSGRTKDGANVSDQYIETHIYAALQSLTDALKGIKK